MTTTSPYFEAQWSGRCKNCNEEWEEGDHIGYIEEYNKPVCFECWQNNDDGYVDYSLESNRDDFGVPDTDGKWALRINGRTV